MEHQDFSKLQTRKLKGLKRTREENEREGEEKKMRTKQMEVVNNIVYIAAVYCVQCFIILSVVWVEVVT